MDIDDLTFNPVQRLVGKWNENTVSLVIRVECCLALWITCGGNDQVRLRLICWRDDRWRRKLGGRNTGINSVSGFT